MKASLICEDYGGAPIRAPPDQVRRSARPPGGICAGFAGDGSPWVSGPKSGSAANRSTRIGRTRSPQTHRDNAHTHNITRSPAGPLHWQQRGEPPPLTQADRPTKQDGRRKGGESTTGTRVKFPSLGAGTKPMWRSFQPPVIPPAGGVKAARPRRRRRIFRSPTAQSESSDGADSTPPAMRRP